MKENKKNILRELNSIKTDTTKLKMQLSKFIEEEDINEVGRIAKDIVSLTNASLEKIKEQLIENDKDELPTKEKIYNERGNYATPEEVLIVYNSIQKIPDLNLDTLSALDDSESFRNEFNKCFVKDDYSDDKVALFSIWHKTILANYIQILAYSTVMKSLRERHLLEITKSGDEIFDEVLGKYEIFIERIKEEEEISLNAGGNNIRIMGEKIAQMLAEIKENYDLLNQSMVKFDNFKNNIYDGVYKVLEKRLYSSFKINIDKIIAERKDNIKKTNSASLPKIVVATVIAVLVSFAGGYLGGSQHKEYEMRATIKQLEAKLPKKEQ